MSIGAGFGVVALGSLGLGGGALGGLGALEQSQPSAPAGTALIEVALTRSFRAVAGVNGYYRRSENVAFSEYVNPTTDNDTIVRTPVTTTTWGHGLRAGMRWVINPGGVVEVSPLMTFGWSRYRSEDRRDATSDSPYGDANRKSQSFDVQLGLVLERALMEHLYLRFESSLFQYSQTNGNNYAVVSNAPQISDREDTFVGFAFSPSLQLRLTF